MSRLAVRTVRTLTDVLARFGIVPEELHDIRSGRSNKHRRVVAGGRGYAPRRHQPRRSTTAIQWEMALLDRPSGRGCPVAPALTTLEAVRTRLTDQF
jgi:hypothetical protein